MPQRESAGITEEGGGGPTAIRYGLDTSSVIHIGSPASASLHHKGILGQRGQPHLLASLIDVGDIFDWPRLILPIDEQELRTVNLRSSGVDVDTVDQESHALGVRLALLVGGLEPR